MLRDILDSVAEKLEEHGVEGVYTAFDAQPMDHKQSGIITIVGIGDFESSTPIYSQYTVYLPFTAGLELKLTAPEGYSMEQLYEYYDGNIFPVVSELSGMTCRTADMNVKFDSNIQRLVLSVRLKASGITRIERSAE